MSTAKTLTPAEVATQIGCEPEHVKLLARRGDLVGFKTGRGGKTSPWRFRQAQVDAFIATREAATRSGRRTA